MASFHLFHSFVYWLKWVVARVGCLHTHTHTDVPSSGGVRSEDKATRGRGRRTTALTVPAREKTESENGVFLQVTLPFHYFTPSLSHTHTHTQMSHQVAFVLETRQPEAEVEVAVGEPLLVQFQQEGKLSENEVFLPLGHP